MILLTLPRILHVACIKVASKLIYPQTSLKENQLGMNSDTASNEMLKEMRIEKKPKIMEISSNRGKSKFRISKASNS